MKFCRKLLFTLENNKIARIVKISLLVSFPL